MKQKNIFGVLVKHYRRQANMSQKDLSEKAGVAYSWVTKLEGDQISEPSILKMAKVAEALGRSLDDFVFWRNAVKELTIALEEGLSFNEPEKK